jgi:hypothetical protein
MTPFNPRFSPMRSLSTALVLCASAALVVAADEFKPEPGFKLLFNGKSLDGWQQKAGKKDDKAAALDGKTEAFDKRFVVKDGELVIDPKVKGDRYIETVAPVGGDFTLRFDFKPDEKCNNDLLFLGTKFDINSSNKNLKGLKVNEWNAMEIAVKGGAAEYKINGEVVGTQKTKGDKGPFALRAEFGGIAIKNVRISEGK